MAGRRREGRPTLTTNHPASDAARESAGRADSPPPLGRSALRGAAGFAAASLLVFATVAFAERWMYARLGLWGAYLAWTALFVVAGGAALAPLAGGRWRGPKFFLLFGLAFFAYAVGWVGAYFALRGAAGEWAGALAGSLSMGVVLAAGFGAVRRAPLLSAALLASHTAGYFLGSALNDLLGGRAGMLTWGGLYGLCFGAGLGAALHLAQARRR